MSVVCYPVEVSATGRSLSQRNPTECGVSECDRGTLQTKPRPTRGCSAMRKKFNIAAGSLVLETVCRVNRIPDGTSYSPVDTASYPKRSTAVRTSKFVIPHFAANVVPHQMPEQTRN